MNATTYKPRPSYAYRATKPKPASTDDRKHPVREEIDRLIGNIPFTLSVVEDLQTLDSLKVAGMIGFLAVLKRGDRKVSEGRGSAVLNRNNRWVERSIHSAYNASIVDCLVRASKLDMLLPELALPPHDMGVVVPEAFRSDESHRSEISDKQLAYLTQLIQVNFSDQDEIDRRTAQLSELTREEPSQEIQALKR